MDSPRTRMYTHPFFEATPPGAAPGPPVKNRVPVFATSGGVITSQCSLRRGPRERATCGGNKRHPRCCGHAGAALSHELRRWC